MLECLIERASWKKQLLPMWALMSILFVVHHFTSNPTDMWHGSLFEQLPNTQKMGLPFSHTHAQNRNKKNN